MTEYEDSRHILIIEPVSDAIDHTKHILFSPFDLGKWFIIGFCAWLATIFQGKGNFNFNSFGNINNSNTQTPLFENAKLFFFENMYWIIPLSICVVILIIAIGLVFLWLRSRGKFMFLHCIATNQAEVAYPWSEYSQQGNSLFMFKVLFNLISMVIILIPFGLIALSIYAMINHPAFHVAAIVTLIVSSILLLPAAIITLLVNIFTSDFVIPIMFNKKQKCLESWKELIVLLKKTPGKFTLYLLFKIVIGIAINALVLIAGLLTCCCLFCLLAFPYVGTVALLPVLILKRSYSLFFFRQYGPDYDVFRLDTTGEIISSPIE